jgi:Zinc binding domain
MPPVQLVSRASQKSTRGDNPNGLVHLNPSGRFCPTADTTIRYDGKMNKAFVREPDDDGRAYCPRCRSLGIEVGSGPLDAHVLPESRDKLRDDAWFCNFPRCDVAYFNQFDVVVGVDELNVLIYPKEPNAPICACFGLTYDDVEADVREGTPTRIRTLLAQSKSPEANCATLAADGRCCMQAVQELYMKLRT